MLAYSVPPGYRRRALVRRPKLDAFIAIIDQWLEADRAVPRKQRHTAKRVFDRLRDEHGFAGGYTIIKDYMRDRDRRGQEMFVPLSFHPFNGALLRQVWCCWPRSSAAARSRWHRRGRFWLRAK
jgi:hypothetical protein